MSIVEIPGMSPIWLQWEDNNRISDLSKRTGFSETEVIQHALRIYENVLDYDNGNGCFDCFSRCYDSSIEEFDISKLPCGCSAKAQLYMPFMRKRRSLKMNLWNRFKFLLLRWLLGDICCKSDCENCIMRTRVRLEGCNYEGWGCEEQDVFYQARKVWRIE